MVLSGLKDSFVYYALNHPKRITWVMVVATVLLLGLAALPNFVQLPYLHQVTVDTDPENMLSDDEPVRKFNDINKKVFSLNDMVVVGIVNDKHPQGVFNKQSLDHIYQLTQFARTLSWPDEEHPGTYKGVVEADMIAPSMVDNIEQGGIGEVNFSWLMPQPPSTDEAALAIRERARNIPFLNGTLISEDGKAIALYLPLTSKDMSYKISKEIETFTAQWTGDDQVHITGLPVAEDTFGVEMFIQMAISAPLAMLVIFLLLWFFFKRLILVVSPMIVAMVSAMTTMALLVISGNTIHIMSSMIPIFVMPIAVLDAVHILSEFFDRYPVIKDKRKTIAEVMHTLFTPMFYTSLTTIAAFASLALTPIPPVQVFGIFVALGVLIAWLLTILFIPAYLMMIPEHKLANYGHVGSEGEHDHTAMGRFLSTLGQVTGSHPVMIVIAGVIFSAIAGFGISKIEINDNPIKWFDEKHDIRIADQVLNEHFGGTYMAYLSLVPKAVQGGFDPNNLQQTLAEQHTALIASGLTDQDLKTFEQQIKTVAAEAADTLSALSQLSTYVDEQMARAEGDDYFAWDQILLILDAQRQNLEVFKQPDTLRWMSRLQDHLLQQGKVGKINSVVDVVKTVHRELLLGQPEQFRIPDTVNAVGQTLITYQNSHRPQDLWHFVTPDYRQANLWLQLTSGDNKDMESVIKHLDTFLTEEPAPNDIQLNWFGLTYINVVWQEKMVTGMLMSFLGSFAVVLVMMVILFRSLLWGILSMIPLTFTVALIYGVIGLIGKDYDMPVAILSSLSLGLAVDYSIHFIARSREAVAETGDWMIAIKQVFGEPARAISRNAIVLSAGFLPLLAAPLVPYQTVGIFIATIILSAGIATLVILPALMTLLRHNLFKKA